VKPSFWTTAPGVITAIAGLITAIGGLIGVLYTIGAFDSDDDSSSVSREVPVSGAITSTSGDSSTSSDSDSSGGGGGTLTLEGCLTDFFETVEPDRIRAYEVGADDADVISTAQPKGPPVGMVVTEGGQAVAALKVALNTSTAAFTIDSVVDDHCNPIAYRIEGASEVAGVAQSYDDVVFELGGRGYAISLSYETGSAQVDVVGFAP